MNAPEFEGYGIDSHARSPWTVISLAACVATLAALTSCGVYLNQRQLDAVLATTWSPDVHPVFLLQELTRHRRYLGWSPHVVDPRVERAGLVLLDATDHRIRVQPDESWGSWTISQVLSRSAGGGFIVEAYRYPGVGERERLCLVITTSGVPVACPWDDWLGTGGAYLINDGREVVHAEGGAGQLRVRTIATGAARPIDEPFFARPWTGSDAVPCSLDRIALAPDQHAWVVACTEGVSAGLWQIERSGDTQLLVSFTDVGVKGPPGALLSDIEDRVRLFSQTFGLAWSPDSTRVYYCSDRNGRGLIVDTTTRRWIGAPECLTGVAWSPDGRQIAGTGADAHPRAVEVRSF